MNIKKRALALFLAIVMLASVTPFAVFGEITAPELEIDGDGYYLINNYKELNDHIWANRDNIIKTIKYRLNADLIADSDAPILVMGVRAVIDLNGHELSDTFHSHSSMILIKNKGHLTVRDTSEAQTGLMLFQSSYAQRSDLDDEDTGLVYMFWAGANSTLEIESGSFEQTSKGAIVGANGSTVRIYDGNFSASSSKSNGGFFAVDVQRTSADVPASMIFIYGGTFHTMSDLIWFDAYYYDDTYPIVAVLGGEFYTDSELGFNYYRGTGDTFIGGGLIPISSYEHSISNHKSYADGALKTEETIDGKKYIRVTAPQWIVTDTLTAQTRFNDATLRYFFSDVDKDSAYYAQYGDIIEEYLKKPLTAQIGERDLDPVYLRVFTERSDVKRMRLFSSGTIASNWADTTWNLVEAIDSPEGEVTFTVARPMKEATRYYRLRIEYEDGTEWSDYIGLDFAEPAPVMSGTAFPTMGNVRFGETLFCGLNDFPSEMIPIESLRFEWYADEELIGTQRTIKLDDSSWVGKELTVKVTSTIAEGAIVSAPVTIKPRYNYQTPTMPNATAELSGGGLAEISVKNTVSTQEYIFSTKTKDALTESDWVKSIYTDNAGFVYNAQGIADRFGFEPSEGDTVYIHTRFAATEGSFPGENVVSASVYIGETVYLNSIVFPDAVNDTIYYEYNGYPVAHDITYLLNPGNANAGGDIRWRVNSPLTLEYPTSPVSVKDSEGYITIEINGVGDATITAYYQTAIQTNYGSLHVVVYDPKNVDTNIIKPVEPLQDVTIYAGSGYSAQIPEFYPVPTVDVDYKWYFTKGTMFGYDRLTTTDFASIDPATGEIKTSAPGTITVSLFANESLVDSYELTVFEKPYDYIALEELFTDSSAIKLQVGEKRTIKLLKSPANASVDSFTFTSSDPNVASVDGSGIVSAHSEGEAEITVTAPSEGVSATVKVTVKGVGIPSFIPGDANGDGELTARDVILVMRAALPGFKTPEEFIFAAADMDANGEITARDVIDVMKAVLAAVQGK